MYMYTCPGIEPPYFHVSEKRCQSVFLCQNVYVMLYVSICVNANIMFIVLYMNLLSIFIVCLFLIISARGSNRTLFPCVRIAVPVRIPVQKRCMFSIKCNVICIDMCNCKYYDNCFRYRAASVLMGVILKFQFLAIMQHHFQYQY
jgi:hypothetical protein